MRELGLRAVRMKGWKKTTDQDRDARTTRVRNHMLDVRGVRNFASDTPGDVTRRGRGYIES